MKQEDIVIAIKCLQEKQKEFSEKIESVLNEYYEQCTRARCTENRFLVLYPDSGTFFTKYHFCKSYEDAKDFVRSNIPEGFYKIEDVLIKMMKQAEKERDSSLKYLEQTVRSLRDAENLMYNELDDQHRCLVIHRR
jgi:hypothetical protein